MGHTNLIVPDRPPINTAATRADKPLAGTCTQTTVPADRILVTCPHCGTILSVRRVYIGDGVRCKQCSQRFLVPAAPGAQPVGVYDCPAGVASTESHKSDVDPMSHRPDSVRGSLMKQLAQFIASHDELRANHDRLLAEHDGVRVERDGVRATLGTTSEERDALVVQLREREDELCTVRAERDALTTNLGNERAALAEASAEIAQLKQQGAESERAIAVQLDESNAELERNRAALSASKQARHEEVQQLTAQLTSLKQQHELLIEQHQSAESLFANLQASNQELIAAQEQLAAEYRKQIESEQLERAKLASELSELRAESEEMARLAEQWISAAMHLPTVPVASAEELEAAQIPMDALGQAIAESDDIERLMAETLDSSGVRASKSREGRRSTAPANNAL